MTDDTIPPDPVVRTAIKLLPVPEHATSFWVDLHARLDGEPQRGGVAVAERPVTALPGGDPRLGGDHDLIQLGLVPPALRRRSNAVISAVAVAAAIIVVVAGTTLVRERGASDVESDLAAVPASSTSEPSRTSIAALSGVDAQLPTSAVLAWVADLGEGDTAGAWSALGPASRAHFGSKSTFAADSGALAEGYGAWSATEPDEVIVTPLLSSGDGQLVVVTLVGEVQQQGSRAPRADAFPVRIADGAATVELWAFAGELQMVVPDASPAVGAPQRVGRHDELVVVIPRGVAAPTIRLDDGAPMVCGEAEGTELEELNDAPGQLCTYHPEGGIPTGERVLTVAFTAPDGEGVSAESVLFEAA